jgi:hypothetical protein
VLLYCEGDYELMESREVIIGISGGLGNQLFQLATAVDLRADGHKVQIDPIYNDLNNHRATEIYEFATDLEIPIKKRNLFLTSLLRVSIVKRFYILMLNKNTIFESKNFESPLVPKEKQNFRLFGYWQTINSAITIQKNLSDMLKSSQVDEIALHVRRGDYLSEQHSLHGALHGKYYLKAIENLEKKTGFQRIVIFTDSPEIVKKEEWFQSLDKAKVRVSTSKEPWDTLLEMASYSAIICSNSTFSWWAAFIGGNKSVILPNKWFQDTLLPKSLRIPGSHVIESSFIKGFE